MTLSIFEKDHHGCESKKLFFFHLLALSEGTWHCLSLKKTTMDVKAKKKFFFSIYLPLLKGHDIVYLWKRPPWMRKQKSVGYKKWEKSVVSKMMILKTGKHFNAKYTITQPNSNFYWRVTFINLFKSWVKTMDQNFQNYRYEKRKLSNPPALIVQGYSGNPRI